MKTYVKPELKVISLQIEEQITATVPRTNYKKAASGTQRFSKDTLTQVALKEETSADGLLDLQS